MKNTTGNKNVPNRVAMLRKNHGLSQTELGDMLLLSQRTISDIERGINCSLDNLVLIAELFGVSIDYITMRSDENKTFNKCLDRIDISILAEIKKLDANEKARVLEHIKLDNELKSRNS